MTIKEIKMTESLLQAENRELKERVAELERQVRLLLPYMRQAADLIEENHKMADIILDKQME